MDTSLCRRALLATIGEAAALIRLVMRRDESHLAQLRQDVTGVTQTLQQIQSGQPVGAPAPAVALAPEPPVAQDRDGRVGAAGCHGSAGRRSGCSAVVDR